MRPRIAVIGDLMLDVDNIVEAVTQKEGRDCLAVKYQMRRLGTSGAVAKMLMALEVDPILIGVAAVSDIAMIRRMLDCTSHILGSGTITTRRERFYFEDWTIAGPRVDYNGVGEIVDQDQVYLGARAIGCAADAFIVCDHGRGVVGPEIMAKLKRTGKPIFVDPHSTSDFGLFSEVECLCLNRQEAVAATDAQPSPKNIMQKIDADGLWWYREGWLFPPERTFENRNEFDSHRLWFPTMADNVVDCLGAGDQFIATLAAARVRGDHWEPAIVQAMAAAGLQCEQRGIVPVGWEAIHERMGIKLDPGGNVSGATDQGRPKQDDVPRLLGGN